MRGNSILCAAGSGLREHGPHCVASEMWLVRVGGISHSPGVGSGGVAGHVVFFDVASSLSSGK